MNSNIEERPINFVYEGHKYIMWFFRLLCSFILLVILLLLFLKVNDTVNFTEGEILSAAPQTNYKAPFESKVLSVYVKPGQKVKKGDTMIVLYNKENKSLLVKERAEAQRLKQSIASINQLLQTVSAKSSSVNRETRISNSNMQIEEENIHTSIKSLEEQYALQQQKLASAKERNQADSILYSKDMISKMEYNEGKDITRNLQETIAATEAMLKQQKANINANKNFYNKESQYISQRQTDATHELQILMQQKTDAENKLFQSNETIALLEYNMSQQHIIAAVDGTVNTLFNISQTSNIISKDELLVVLTPSAGGYYAKAYIPEKDIQYVRNDMQTHLKLDAYANLDMKVLNGRVSYVSERKENEKFYVLIELQNSSAYKLKPGYIVNGQILTERLPLYKFFIKIVFDDADVKQSQS